MSSLRIIATALLVSFSAGYAAAQSNTTQPQDTARTDQNAEREIPPLSGANSFTEEQARERITTAGYTGVSALSKDEQGIWRGTATKSGQQYQVALDYRGNIVQSQ